MRRPTPYLRNDTYWFRRRVPRQFAEIEEREFVHVSLKTDSLTEAEAKINAVWAELVAGWEAMLKGTGANVPDPMKAAREIAKSQGVRYLPVERVARLPMSDILDRIDGAFTSTGKLHRGKGRVLLGGVKPARMTIRQAWTVYWDLTKDHRHGMTDDQIRVWKNPRKRSVYFMADTVGDIDLSEIQAEELLDFRDAMWDRVASGAIKRQTANKEMGHVFHVLRTVNQARRIGLNFDFRGLPFSGGDQATRPPYSDGFIRSKLLAPGALDGMNSEARCILLGMINTGYRPIEGAGLRPGDIRLDADIPHIDINPEHRRVKTASSVRILPLVGVSLEAFRAFPDGFPRYRDSPGITSAVNKYLTENGLRETPNHSMYCLRHSFEDRLLNAGIDERIRRDLMGHRLRDRPRYGAGARLGLLHDILQRVAI